MNKIINIENYIKGNKEKIQFDKLNVLHVGVEFSECMLLFGGHAIKSLHALRKQLDQVEDRECFWKWSEILTKWLNYFIYSLPSSHYILYFK